MATQFDKLTAGDSPFPAANAKFRDDGGPHGRQYRRLDPFRLGWSIGVAHATDSGRVQRDAPQAMAETHTDTVLIIDFGSQVTQLIARRVREQGVYSEIVPFNRAEDALERLKPRAVILSGGPASVTEFGTPRAPDWVFNSGLPVLGICYGEQTMVAQLGGDVEGGHHREFGRADLEITGTSALFEGVWDKGANATPCG